MELTNRFHFSQWEKKPTQMLLLTHNKIKTSYGFIFHWMLIQTSKNRFFFVLCSHTFNRNNVFIYIYEIHYFLINTINHTIPIDKNLQIQIRFRVEAAREFSVRVGLAYPHFRNIKVQYYRWRNRWD
jgi:hypothetical protein